MHIPIIGSRMQAPIVGAPFTFRGWYPVATINCNGCEEKAAVTLTGVGAPNTCPVCKRAFIIESLVAMPDGNVGLKLTQVVLHQRAAGNGSTS